MYVISKVSAFLTGIGVLLLLVQVISYFLTSALNPGIPDRDVRLPKNSGNVETYVRHLILVRRDICHQCKVLRKPAAHIVHCSECDVCIEGGLECEMIS